MADVPAILMLPVVSEDYNAFPWRKPLFEFQVRVHPAAGCIPCSTMIVLPVHGMA